MFTQCPDCHKTYLVTKKQLRGKKAKIYCPDCKKKFNVSVLLNESSTAPVQEVKVEYRSGSEPEPNSKLTIHSEFKPPSVDASSFLRTRIADIDAESSEGTEANRQSLPWEVEKKPLSINWNAGFVVGCLLLLGQVVYFEAENIVQNAVYRPKIEKFAGLFGFALPVYENVNEFEVLESSLIPGDEAGFTFKATINNQAAFKQRLPKIRLALLDYNEQIFAERVFDSKKYSAGLGLKSNFIAPDETIQVSLNIAPPKTKVGGYHFDLLY